jgi:acetylornithine deacetylase/succinyl-diaminopimelate desuccinylase-like protein
MQPEQAMAGGTCVTGAGADTVEIAQRLVQFDTTNPPGNEAACIDHLEELFGEAGLETRRADKSAARPNLLARLAGRGDALAFLMYGHVDVVPTAGQKWDQPPFAGTIADGMLWGRGTLDMKGGIAMMASALLRAKRAGCVPAGDVLLLALSDEECGSEFGAAHVVEQHADWFDGIRYAICEGGGFSLTMAGKRVYPISVTEKQWCELRVRLRGGGGHASVPLRRSAMGRLGAVLQLLERRRLPVHITPVAEQMIRAIAAALPSPRRQALRGMLRPRLTDRLLDAAGEESRGFDAMLHNTVSPAIVNAATRVDAIPDSVELELDGRVLPGSSPEELVREVRELIGPRADVELTRVHTTGPAEPDMGLFDELAAAIERRDSAAVCVPMILPGATDARFFARLGIQTYGYLPMRLPSDIDLPALTHGANERIPVDTLGFGADVLQDLVTRTG